MASKLLAKAHGYIDSLPTAANTKDQHRNFCERILGHLSERNISALREVTPALVFQNAPDYKSKKAERHALGFFGRFMAAKHLWDERQEREFEEFLTRYYHQKYKPRENKAAQEPEPSAAGQLLRELVVNCGEMVARCSRVRIDDLKDEGISLGSGRMLRYGEGLHRVSKALVDRWLDQAGLRSAKKSDYLFYRRTPRDPGKPAGRAWLMAQLRSAGIKAHGHAKPHMRHFEMDFQRLKDSLGVRLHFQHFHGVSRNRSPELVREFQKKHGFYLPVPYLAAVVAVSQLVDCAPERLRGGRASKHTWPDLNGYEIAVQWPVSFVDEMLRDGHVKPGIARKLIRLGLEACQEKSKIHGVGRFANLDSSLAEKLCLSRVQVRDLKDDRTWQGAMQGRRPTLKVEPAESSDKRKTFRLCQSGRRRRFDLPLLEELKGGRPNGRCAVCCHVDRVEIDDEVRAGGRPTMIAKRHDIPYGPSNHHLLWHAGRLKGKAGHVGSAPAAASVRVPSNFLARVARENAPNLAKAILSLN